MCNQDKKNGKYNEKEFEYDVEMLKIIYTNIQSNERLRNNFFTLFLALTAVFFGLKENTLFDLNPKLINIIIPSFLWLVGLLFLGAFIRYKEMIRRDVDLVDELQVEMYGENQNLLKIFNKHKELLNAKKYPFDSISATLVILTLAICIIVSVFIAFAFIKDNSIFYIIIFGILAVIVNLGAFKVMGGKMSTLTDKTWFSGRT